VGQTDNTTYHKTTSCKRYTVFTNLFNYTCNVFFVRVQFTYTRYADVRFMHYVFVYVDMMRLKINCKYTWRNIRCIHIVPLCDLFVYNSYVSFWGKVYIRPRSITLPGYYPTVLTCIQDVHYMWLLMFYLCCGHAIVVHTYTGKVYYVKQLRTDLSVIDIYNVQIKQTKKWIII